MGIRVTNGDWGVPGLAGPDEQHKHLPFWYDINIENTPPNPVEAFIQMTMLMVMPFMPVKDMAAEWRANQILTSDFIARRAGLKIDHTFKLMPRGEHGLRFAFATLGGMKRFTANLCQLQHDNKPNASNDPHKDAPLSSLSLLPNAFIPVAKDPVPFTPISIGAIKTFPVKGLRAANNRHAQPKAQVLAFKP